MSLGMKAQDLQQHRWENRLIILLSENSDSETLAEQQKLLLADSAGLAERKLLVYTITPDSYILGGKTDSWKKQQGVYERLTKNNQPFEFLLVGLDGGIKLRKTAPVKLADLYRLIDSMPMRAAEIRRKENE